MSGSGLLINPLRANLTKCSNTLKQFVGKLLMDCLSLFGHSVGLASKRLMTPGMKEYLKSDPHLLIFLLIFALMIIALKKWWEMLFISS